LNYNYKIHRIEVIAFACINVYDASRFSVATGNWNETSAWAETSSGTTGQIIPITDAY